VRIRSLLSQRPTDQQESPARSPPITAGPCSSSLAQRYPTQLSQPKSSCSVPIRLSPSVSLCNSISPALLLACAACCEASSSSSGPCPLYSYSLHVCYGCSPISPASRSPVAIANCFPNPPSFQSPSLCPFGQLPPFIRHRERFERGHCQRCLERGAGRRIGEQRQGLCYG
jgi:hypothetical protein